MSKSSPSDLVVVFRGLQRRLGAAVEPLHGDDRAVAAEVAQLRGVLFDAGALIGCEPSGAAIADAMAQRRPDEWTEEILDAVRSLALRAGEVLRRIASIADAVAGQGER